MHHTFSVSVNQSLKELLCEQKHVKSLDTKKLDKNGKLMGEVTKFFSHKKDCCCSVCKTDDAEKKRKCGWNARFHNLVQVRNDCVCIALCCQNNITVII